MTKDTTALEAMYSVADAARMLGGVSKFTIYAWMSRGLLERTRVGGRVMVRESSLLKLLEQGKKQEAARSKKAGTRTDRENTGAAPDLKAEATSFMRGIRSSAVALQNKLQQTRMFVSGNRGKNLPPRTQEQQVQWLDGSASSGERRKHSVGCPDISCCKVQVPQLQNGPDTLCQGWWRCAAQTSVRRGAPRLPVPLRLGMHTKHAN